ISGSANFEEEITSVAPSTKPSPRPSPKGEGEVGLPPPFSQPTLTDASILFNNSFVLRSRCQRQTTTRSCSGSIQIVFEPAPSAAKLVRGALGHCLPCEFNHQR